MGSPARMDDAPLQFGHFTVARRPEDGAPWVLGRGAMGETLKAWDTVLHSYVALKVISPGLLGAPGIRERFEREARAAAHLNHPNVASVFHLGEAADGRVFYALEFVEGETLEAHLAGRGGTPLPVRRALTVILQAAQGLAAAHDRALIHRDIKPANLMLVRRSANDSDPGADEETEPRVKVIDFGLAKLLRPGPGAGGADDAGLTKFEPLGTPHYMSPEQIEPETVGGAVDARADIYALGATFWFLLTGVPPFRGSSSHQVLSQHLHKPPPLARLTADGIPDGIVTLLGRMLAKSPADRPAGYGELLPELRRLLRALSPAGQLPPTPDGTRGSAGTTFVPPRLGTKVPGGSGGWRRRIVAVEALFGAAVTVALVAAFAWHKLLPFAPPPPPPPPAAPDAGRSIAVLPFENLSDDKDNAFFADGIQDDVLTSLAKIKELKVVSRSSVMGYRDPARRDLRAISRQLGVNHLLAGRVRRAGNRVLVNVELVDTADGRQVWAQRYDRTLTDSLSLQGELATEIASALHASLSPAERANVVTRPTADPAAYDLYLRGREQEGRPGYLVESRQAAAGFYGQAIARDPAFALAHARLANVLTYLYANGSPTPELRERARRAADEARRLRPDLGEGHLARAFFLYRVERDYPGALDAAEVARGLLPNDPEAECTVAYIHRRQGRWRETLDGLRRAQSRDPRDLTVAEEIFVTTTKVRDWPAALAAGEAAATRAADAPALALKIPLVHLWQRGDLAPLRAALTAVPPGVDPDGFTTLARWDAAGLARDFTAAEAAAAGAPPVVFSTLETPLPAAYLRGSAALARGDTARARTEFEAARPRMEADAAEVPLSPFRHATLGLLYAYLGRREDALREGRRAVELVPEAVDAADGPSASGALAVILARVGETDEALALVERLLTTPAAPLEFFEGSITLQELRMRWQWDGLRENARFQKILAGPEPVTVYR